MCVHMLDFLATIQKRGHLVGDIEKGHMSTAVAFWPTSQWKLAGRLLTTHKNKSRLTISKSPTACAALIARRGNIPARPN